MITLVISALAFVGGVAIGDHFAVSLNKAIEVIKTAEANATATLSKITAHKAS